MNFILKCELINILFGSFKKLQFYSFSYNIFTTNLSDMLFLVVTGGQKKKKFIRCKFKLKLIAAYHLWFVVKMLWM